MLKAVGHLWRCPGEEFFALSASLLSYHRTGVFFSLAPSEGGFASLVLCFGTFRNWSFTAEQLKHQIENMKNLCKNAVKNAQAESARWHLSKHKDLS